MLSENIAIAIINDGDGKICGFNYAGRCALADRAQPQTADEWVKMALKAAKFLQREIGTRRARPKEILEAALDTCDYYVKHNEEQS